MDRVKNFGREDITMSFGQSFDPNTDLNDDSQNNNNNNKSNIGNGEQRSIECFADNVKFKCVWQQPEVNMHIINQIMNQMNIFNDNEYGDCTPSNITALISASFPSCETLEGFNDGDNVDCDKNDSEISTFVASTPISTIRTADVMNVVNEKDTVDITNDDKQHKVQLLNAFNDTSPILFQSRHRTMYTKRKLHMN